ncbi:MAG TPA: hypothetical protein VGK84_05055 [Candidatus Tumulicola sp.]
MSDASVLRWLLEGDPAIRWQALNDLTNAPKDEVAAERSRVALEGWGRVLLGRQSSGGFWDEGKDDGWMIAMDAMTLLREMRLDPSSQLAQRAVDRIEKNIRWESLDDRPYFDGETEPCINGAILAFGSYFGVRCDRIVERLLTEQLSDGGWNCDAPPSTRSSFNTTIRVLEGLLEHERRWGGDTAVTAARTRGEKYLLERRLMRRLSNGEIVDKRWTRFAFPTMWHYDVLRGLDYFRSTGTEPDERVAEAIEIVRARRHQNGRWPMNRLHQPRLDFPMEIETGRASRWNTLRATRVLDWYFCRPLREITSSAR